MIAVVWALFAVVLGCALVFRFGGLWAFEPKWAAAALVFGAGTTAGIGLASCLFFVLRLTIPGAPRLSLFVELAIFAWLAYEIWRRRRPYETGSSHSPFAAPLALCLLLALAIVIGAMAEGWDSNPQGGWDAWSIWNLRARFLAAPGNLPRRAWSPILAWTHPEYPLLLSAFIARCWTYAGSMPDAAPAVVSYLYFLALIATVTGGLAIWRSRALGLLAGLVLLGSPSLPHEAISQYSDIPLAAYFTGAVVFLLIDRPILAGLCAGLAAWTKDEGALFLLVLLTAYAIWRREQLLKACAGAIPGAALMLIFKLGLARGSSRYFGQQLSTIAARIFDGGRIGQTLAAFLHEFAGMGQDWYHPVLPIVALAITLRFNLRRRSDLLLAGTIPMAMLAGYFAIFLITPYDLTWQLQSSLNRLLAQVWPCLVLAMIAALRAPEELAIEAPAEAAKSRKKSKARHA